MARRRNKLTHVACRFKSKTDPTGAIDQPVNPMKNDAGGATFIARTHAANVNHMIQTIERVHHRVSVIECLSEWNFPDVFDPANPKGGSQVIQKKKWDNTPEDELRHDVTDELAAHSWRYFLSRASSAFS
jgi:2-oxoglutarate ferredoxin oxidoreductase subunit beta